MVLLVELYVIYNGMARLYGHHAPGALKKCKPCRCFGISMAAHNRFSIKHPFTPASLPPESPVGVDRI
jgi:hypothetical protein